MTLIDAAVSRSRAVICILLLIFVSGSVAYSSIPKESTPDVQIPIIYVSMTHEGISPEDAERLLVRPMEKELKSIEGVKEMRSLASQGHASVTLEFNAGFDNEKALVDVREKVDIAKVELPEDTDEPLVNEVNLSLFPVVNVILTGEVPERTLIKIAKELRDRLEEISSVLSVDIAGDREDVVDIIIDPMVLNSYQLTSDIVDSVTRNNLLVAAGALDTKEGRYQVKVPGLLETAEDILSLPIKVNQDAVVKLEDVTSVHKTYKDPDGFARVNGHPALVLEVSKRTGENIIDTIDAVRAVVAHERQYWPEGLHVIFAQDESGRIRDIIHDLENNIILAILLVSVVILAVIGLRSAVFISIAIPGAFLMGVLTIASLGLTLNIVVLFSLILSIGMLVDSAIVVVEYANRRMVDGASHREAYKEAAKRMAWPIIASTITTLIVFAPLLFWPGIMGQFMKYLPLTLIATLTGSLFMALIFIPTLGSIWGKTDTADEQTKKTIHIAEQGDLSLLQGITGSYVRILDAVLKRAKAFVVSIFAALIGVFILYSAFGAGVEFFPDVEPDNAQVLVYARGNLSVHEKDALVEEVEARIMDMRDDVKVFYARSGEVAGNGNDLTEDVIGIIQMEFNYWQDRRKAKEILAEIRTRTADIPGIMMEAREQEGGPASGKPINIEVSSRFPELIEPVVAQVLEGMQEVGGFVDIEDNRPVPAIEWQVNVDRAQAARFGVDMAVIGNFVRLVTNGLKVTDYRPDDSDDEVDIVLRFPEDQRNLKTLDYLNAVTKDGNIPISNFVERTAQPKVGQISRVDGRRTITVKADVAKGVLANDKVLEMTEWLKKQEINPQVALSFKGEDEDQKETGDFLANAFVLAMFSMMLVLLLQFNSFYHTAIILSAVFLSTIGVLLGLLITGQTFGIVMCGVGIISLGGIVVNNNIIFIDTYRVFRAEGMSPREALLRTGAQRMRPILLTAGTTVLGLLPMVLAMNIDFFTREVTFGAPSTQWWQQLSTSIAGGLTFATILTLFFTPCLIALRDKEKSESISA